MLKLLIVVGVLLAALHSLVSFVDAGECLKDADCVPATCCHAGFCVNRKKAPVCKGTMCTTEVVPFTLDGGGSCSCDARSNKCLANYGNATNGEIHHAKKKKYEYIRAKVGPDMLKHGRHIRG